ncbi:helix-turn-helix transcriptional regulator [Dermabacteraceae bacterium CCM 9519]
MAPPSNKQSPPLSRLWTSAETAQALGISEPALRQMRARGEGPKYIRFGRRVRYSGAAVLAWLKQCTS